MCYVRRVPGGTMGNGSVTFLKSSHYFSKRVYVAGSVLALSASTLAFSGVATASVKGPTCYSANGIKVTNTNVCKGLAFYKGQTLTFIAPTSAGSAYDVESRAFGLEMGAYMGATINTEDISTGASIGGQNALAAATPNGLTIGFFNLASDYYDDISNSPNVNFNFKNVSLLGGLPNSTDILATQSNSPYTSFAALRADDSKASPVKILITPGAAATENILFMREFGLPVTYVSGYTTSANLTTGFIRGDGQLDGSGIASLMSYIEAGTVRVLAVETQALKPSTSIPLYSTLVNFPTEGVLLKKYPAQTNGERAAAKYAALVNTVPNFVLGAPSAVPAYLVKTLQAAVEFAAKSAYVKSQVHLVGNPIGYTNPTKDKIQLVGDLAVALKIRAFLGY